MKTVHRGFTLIELLVSLAIFGVITGTVLANFRTGAQGDELRISSQLVASAIRRTQTAAIAGQLQPVCSGGVNDGKACPGGAGDCGAGECMEIIPLGYGIRFDTADGSDRRITTFVDANGNKVYDAGETLRTESVSSGASVEISALSPSSASALDIVFVPPKPTMYFNGLSTNSSASIVVRHMSSENTRTISVNRISGQVNAE